MKELFTITVTVAKPILVGQDNVNGRRQLIPILTGSLSGVDLAGKKLVGKVLAGGVDSQIIRPNGKAEISARYGVKLTDGRSFFVENNGIRTVPPQYIPEVLSGGYIDPSLYYFVTSPIFEVYDQSLSWLENYMFVCQAQRYPNRVELVYYLVD